MWGAETDELWLKRTGKLTGYEYGYVKNLLHEMVLHYRNPGLLLLQFVTDILVTMYVRYDCYFISI